MRSLAGAGAGTNVVPQRVPEGTTPGSYGAKHRKQDAVSPGQTGLQKT